MELKMARSVLVMTRRDQSWCEREKPEVEAEADQDEDPTAEDETNIPPAKPPGDDQEVTAETDITTAVGGAQDLLTAGTDIPVRGTRAQDQGPGGEIVRRNRKIDTTE